MQKVSTNMIFIGNSAYPYIPIFHPVGFISCIMYSVLIAIGNILDNRSAGKKNSWYKTIIGIILVFGISIVISLFVNVIINLLSSVI